MTLIVDLFPFISFALVIFYLIHKILPPLRSYVDYTPTTLLNEKSAFYSTTSAASQLEMSDHNNNNQQLKSYPRKVFLYQLLLNATIYITLTASLVIVQLVLCEIGDWFSSNARILIWKVCTTCLIAMLVISIPLLEIFTILYTSPIRIISRLNTPLTIVFFSLWLLIFYKLGQFIPLPPSESNSSTNDPRLIVGASSAARMFSYYYDVYHENTRSFFEETLSRIVIIGISAMGVLSGFAAVCTPYTQFFTSPRKIDLAEIERLERSIETTNDLIATKTAELQQIENKLSTKAASSGSVSSTSLRSFIMSIRTVATGGVTGSSDELSLERANLKMELDGLLKMSDSLDSDLHLLRSTFFRQQTEKTLQGKLLKQAYFLFALYCIYRLFNVFILRNPIKRASTVFSMASNAKLLHSKNTSQESISLSKKIIADNSASSGSSSDALAITLAHLVVKFDPNSSLDAWTRQIGFILSGFLFLGSISSAVTTFNSLTKAFPILRIEPHLLFPYNSFRSRSSMFKRHSTIPSAITSSSSSSSSSSALTSSFFASVFNYPSFSLLIISQLLGIYVLSTSLLLRSNLPQEMSLSITSALGAPLDVFFVESLFDTTFVIIALLTVVGLYLAKKMNEDNLDAFDATGLNSSSFGFYDEEKLLD